MLECVMRSPKISEGKPACLAKRLAGLRTGCVLAGRWQGVHLGTRRPVCSAAPQLYTPAQILSTRHPHLQKYYVVAMF